MHMGYIFWLLIYGRQDIMSSKCRPPPIQCYYNRLFSYASISMSVFTFPISCIINVCALVILSTKQQCLRNPFSCEDVLVLVEQGIQLRVLAIYTFYNELDVRKVPHHLQQFVQRPARNHFNIQCRAEAHHNSLCPISATTP